MAWQILQSGVSYKNVHLNFPENITRLYCTANNSRSFLKVTFFTGHFVIQRKYVAIFRSIIHAKYVPSLILRRFRYFIFEVFWGRWKNLIILILEVIYYNFYKVQKNGIFWFEYQFQSEQKLYWKKNGKKAAIFSYPLVIKLMQIRVL